VDGGSGPCGSCVIASQQCEFAPSRKHGKASKNANGKKRKVEEYDSEDGGYEATFDVVGDENVDELQSEEEGKPIAKKVGKVLEASNAGPSKRQRTAVASSPLKNASARSSTRSAAKAAVPSSPDAPSARSSVPMPLPPSVPGFRLDSGNRNVAQLVEGFLERLEDIVDLAAGEPMSRVTQRSLLNVAADIREVVRAACASD
jgi:hypothetical protein